MAPDEADDRLRGDLRDMAKRMAVERLDALADADRLEVLALFCPHCGRPQRRTEADQQPCQCENDE